MPEGHSWGDMTYGWSCPRCDFWTMDFTEIERHDCEEAR